jgi:hypothetical protein
MENQLVENRNALVVNAAWTKATGTAEHEAAAILGAQPVGRRITVGQDKLFATRRPQNSAAC